MESDKKLVFKGVIEYFAYAAIAIHAVFAAFWLFKNIGVLQNDYVAHTYILAADSLKVDDSMGILYALLVRVLGHGVLLQLFQILVLSSSVFFFALTAFEKKSGMIIALLTVLNPVILQAETAVSPNALLLACIPAIIAFVIKISADRRYCPALAVTCLAACFLNPDYTYIIFVSAVIYTVIASLTRKKVQLLLIAIFVISTAVPALVNGYVNDDYAYGRVHRNISYLTLQRTAWPKLYEYAGFMPWLEETATGHESDKDYVSITMEADKLPENFAMVFAHELEEAVGPEAAKDIYRQLSQYATRKGFGYWGHEAVRDEILYLFSPASTALVYLKQRTDTSVQGALNLFLEKAPKLSKIYFLFSLTTGFLFTLMYIVKFIGERFIGKKETGMSLTFALLGIIVLISLYATFVCVRQYDYRNVLFMVIGWPAAAMALTERRKIL